MGFSTNYFLKKKSFFISLTFSLVLSIFIYSNFYYEVNINYNKKYEIPENFSLYKTFMIDGTRIYSIYKKK